MHSSLHCCSCTSLNNFSLQVTETSVQVVEGGEAAFVHLNCTFPPGFFLSNLSLWNAAYITVTSQLTFDTLACHDRKLLQAVLLYSKGNSSTLPCGVTFNSTNWQTPQRLTVHAVVDSPLKDGNQVGKLHLNATIFTPSNDSLNSSDIQTFSLPTVQVKYCS